MTAQQEQHCQRYNHLPVQRKYESVFRIDGVPILPPLMTIEKIQQMRQLRAQASNIERQLAEKRSKNSPELDENSNTKEVHDYVTTHTEWTRVIVEEQSQTSEGGTSEADPYLMLINLLRAHEVETHEMSKSELNQSGNNVPSDEHDEHLAKRMQKLQKSETLVYDFYTDQMVMPITLTDQNEYECGTSGRADRICIEKKKQNVPEGPKGDAIGTEHQIPSISVDPPTPVTTRGHMMYEDPNSKESSMSFQSADELLQSESSNCNENPVNDVRTENHEATFDLKPSRKLSNVPRQLPIDISEKVLNDSCDIKPPQRSATMGSLDVNSITQSDSNLVRSNSFTIEYPSQVLIDHLREQRTKTRSPMKYPSYSFHVMRDTIESKAKRVHKSEHKLREPASRLQPRTAATSCWNSPGNTNQPSSSKITITKRSPYESKFGTKSKAAPVQRNTQIAMGAQGRHTKSRTTMPNYATQRRAEGGVEKKVICNKDLKLSEIEVEHKERLMKLIKHQQQEKMILEKSYQSQKKMLMDQLIGTGSEVKSPRKMREPYQGTRYVSNAGPSVDASPNPRSDYSGSKIHVSPSISLSSSLVSLVASGGMSPNSPNLDMGSLETTAYSTISSTTINVNHSTPRRRLFSTDRERTAELTAAVTGQNYGSSIRRHSTADDHTMQASCQEQQLQAAAATIINACARGFLVRRLFQTEQIQRIVQTIRDTLIFVLNLHIETQENPDEGNTPENIQLKARLLQQLSSASRTLHLVFFQTTIKERMEIIARDRKRIKTKLLTMNRKRYSNA